MMQRPTRYFASFALCLFLSLITAPSPTSVVLGLDLGRLAGAAIAFSIGASLGRASRGRGRGRSRSYGRRRYGKREAEQVFEEYEGLIENETNLISDGFDVMRNSDPSACFERIICIVATGEKEYSMMSPLMNFVSDNEEKFVPAEMKQFSSDLKLAKKIGQAGKNIEICQDTFKCPFTGEEILKMTLEDFYPDLETTAQHGFEERTNYE